MIADYQRKGIVMKKKILSLGAGICILLGMA
jgi:hypothetical protein